uniref:Uncharacterized protein n=1 Tax=Cannabis sativa TaxID=3483 RepID=A0A803NIZ5_CANSA
MDDTFAMLDSLNSPWVPATDFLTVLVSPEGPTKETVAEPKVDVFLANPTIPLTPTNPDDERVQLWIAKHNYAIDEQSKEDVWNLNLDPMTDWFSSLLGSSLVPLASKMVSHFAADLVQLPTRRFASCASSNPIYQVQDMGLALTSITAEAGCLSKNLIDQGYVVAKHGGIWGMLKKVKEAGEQKETLHNDILVEKALKEREQKAAEEARTTLKAS